MSAPSDKRWELTILDADIQAWELDCLNAADIDNDGNMEIIAGGKSDTNALSWYRPATGEKGLIFPSGFFHVGMAIEDIDGSGVLGIVVGEERSKGSDTWMLTWFQPQKDLHQPWARNVIDPEFEGGAHDILFVDIDGDGKRELIAIACYTSTPGIYILKPNDDLTKPWRKYAVYEGIFSEGLSIGDIDGDGRLEIVCGPDLYTQPEGGTYAGKWRRQVYAPTMREMCRTALGDLTGSGRPDIIVVESEYMDGYLSWYENRMIEDPEHPFIEHRVEEEMVYAHALEAIWNAGDKIWSVYTAEMEQGGWDAPYNFSSRLCEYRVTEEGKNWDRHILHKDDGVCGAVVKDIDNDGELEIIGKSLGRYWNNPKVQIWDKKEKPSVLTEFKHTIIDRDKPLTGVDVFAVDLRNSGCNDILCGNLFYRNPDWARFEIPGIAQVISVYDLDGDGRDELIAIDEPEVKSRNFYENLSSKLCWLKPVDPEAGVFEKGSIGTGRGDWPHGAAVAPVLPGGKPALLTAYHSCNGGAADYPELFAVPDDLRAGSWEKRTLAEIIYGEEFRFADLTGNGLLDIIAGCYWLENLGGGQFKPWRFAENSTPARARLMDVNGNGTQDIVIAQEVADWNKKIIGWSALEWYENPGDPRQVPWKRHGIDTLRCVHSLDTADLDGDGIPEIICAEHDPFWPYRSRCRTLIFKQSGSGWVKYDLDRRFEQHDGAKVVELSRGRNAIVGHGWADSCYLHLWELS